MQQAKNDGSENSQPPDLRWLIGDAPIDGNAVLCRPNDSRLAVFWSDRGGYECDDEGAVCIVIGCETTDEKCERLASRFGLSAATLVAFRNQQ